MPSLAFAKLVATPTDNAWSQVYNAGNLFACLSLSKKSATDENENNNESALLSSIGKEIFSNIEAEFFTLEEKNLESIKEAIHHATKTIPEEVDANLCLVCFKNNVLYVFIVGNGAVIMKRDEKTGALLEKNDSENQEIISCSGLLKNGDTIILQTPQFARDMPLETISSALELSLPNDIAEALSPAMHEKDDGGQAAIIINYQGSSQPLISPEEANHIPEPITSLSENVSSEAEILKQVEEVEKEEKIEEELELHPHVQKVDDDSLDAFTPTAPKFNFMQFAKDKLAALPMLKKGTGNNPLSRLSHKNKLYLSIAVAIAIVLVVSIVLTKNNDRQKRAAALFESIYNPALKNYEDGADVKSINQEFARTDFLRAQKILKDGEGKFKKGSTEDNKIADLKAKIDSELGGESAAASKITPKEAKVSSNDLLNVEKNNSDGIAFTSNKDTVNYITEKAVLSVNGDKKTDLIKNDKYWDKPVGIAAYQGNIFVLDQKNGVLKFVAGSDGFGKNTYFKGTGPDLSNATAIAIDGSIWILFENGEISKYTRGVAEEFKIKGIDKPAQSATRLFTNIELENLYVLDPGNSRILKINKEGAFQQQYVADILKNAKDLEVSEKDGKILVLSGGKIWEIPL